ncbi:MAG: thioredoxin, partial [Polyangiales bacterium]
MSILQVGDQSFEQEVLRSDLPVLVDLYADWCQPCKQIAPLLQTLAEAHAGKLKVVQVDIDHNPVVAQSFQVQSIPMLLVFQGGRMVNYHVGMLDRARLDALVEAVLPPSADEVKPQELAELLQAGRALPIDIRDAASFARYHIPAAEHHAA